MNIRTTMTKETMHEALSTYVSQQIKTKSNDLSAVEWVQVMNHYSHHLSAQECAQRMGISVAEIKMIYYHFSMELANYAMEHLK